MAYTFINAPASLAAVISGIISAATAQGWAHNAPSGWDNLQLTSGGATYHFNLQNTTLASYGPAIAAYGATAYNSAAAITAQTNCSPAAYASNYVAGSFLGAYIFSGTTYVHTVVQTTAGVFFHLHMGVLENGTGAQYIQTAERPITTASSYFEWVNYPTYFNNPFSYNGGQGSQTSSRNVIGSIIDGAWAWKYIGASSPGRLILPCVQGLCDDMFARSQQPYNGVTPLLPMPVFAERSLGNVYSYLGTPPSMRYVNMYQHNPGDVITLGSDTWMLFPMVAKNATQNVYESVTPNVGTYFYGLALKQ